MILSTDLQIRLIVFRLLTAVFSREDYGNLYLVGNQSGSTFHSYISTTNYNSIATGT